MTIASKRVVLLAGAMLACVAAVSAAQRSAAPYARLAITQPAPEETVHDNTGKVQVALDIEPPLDAAAGDRIRVRVDGKMRPERWTAQRFALTGIDRGAHTLQAVITDGADRPLIRSDVLTFYMWRASRLFPSRHGSAP